MTLRLGLIGDNIAQSRSPELHQQAGKMHDIVVTYDRLAPRQMGASFKQVLESCAAQGYHGVNVTHPYKEDAARLVTVQDQSVRAIGAVNTIVFDAGVPTGYNTDYSGFVSAYKQTLGQSETGPVLMIGAGGVGRAVAFGLASLGTKDLRLMDRDIDQAKGLMAALKTTAPDMSVTIWTDVAAAATDVSGLVNCTPVGMADYPGTPLPDQEMHGAQWAFDAVYTPVDTAFLLDAKANGLAIISGWDLFFFQGLHAWRIFSDLPCDGDLLRQNLSRNEETS